MNAHRHAVDDDREAIFLRLKEILTEIIGPDAAEIVGIREDSSFARDLEMDSIQIIAFAEQANALYGERFNFFEWVSKQPLKKLFGLTVGDIAALIAKGVS
ncbi:MAG: hypothetical protein LBU45_07810 [Azoarcus sp.]|jgi:acyl carrier protein|nr:hypothetical protein [Azoarcus sp.]